MSDAVKSIYSHHKRKLDECEENGSVHNNLRDLSAFKVKKILSNNTNRKVVCLEGSFDSVEGVGLVVLEKTAFEEENLIKNGSDYFAQNSALKKQFHNDIYGNYEYFPKAELNCRLCVHLTASPFVYNFLYSCQNYDNTPCN